MRHDAQNGVRGRHIPSESAGIMRGCQLATDHLRAPTRSSCSTVSSPANISRRIIATGAGTLRPPLAHFFAVPG